MRLITLVPLLVLATPAQADERAAAAYNAARGGVSMVAMRSGEVIYEDYPNGGAREKAYELASGTKSFSGVIAAAAVQDGLLELDERAADTLAEWRSDPQKARITIRQLLSLTSGVEGAGLFRPPTYDAAVAQGMAHEPGTTFDYDPVHFQIFGEIMRRKLVTYEGGRYPDAVAYLQARILDPLGVEPAQWNRKNGLPTLPSGADFAARDWALFGDFVRRGGRWKDRQLVDAAALAACFAPTPANPGYGLTWWLNADASEEVLAAMGPERRASDLFTHPRRNELPGDLVMAAGAGGQRLYIIPSAQLVIVRQYPRIFERRLGARGERFSDVEFLLAFLSER